MAGLPLYLMAIPLRRSLAAGIDSLQKLHGYNVEASSAPARRARSLHAVGASANLPPHDSVILSEAKRSRRIPPRDLNANAAGFLDFARNDSAFTAILTVSNLGNRQCRLAHCRRQSRPDRQCGNQIENAARNLRG